MKCYSCGGQVFHMHPESVSKWEGGQNASRWNYECDYCETELVARRAINYPAVLRYVNQRGYDEVLYGCLLSKWAVVMEVLDG